MAPHSRTPAWKIPWTEEPGGLQSTGSLRDSMTEQPSLSLFTFMHWRRTWQPTPVFLPGESQGRRSLVGCRLRGRTESDTTEATQQQQQQGMYGNTTLSIRPSHSPSSLTSTSPSSTSEAPFLLHKQAHLYYFSRFHIHALIYGTCFPLSDLLHSDRL